MLYKHGSLSLVLLVFILCLAITGCYQISREKAEEISKDFVAKSVKFYATEGNSKQTLPDYQMTILDSYKEGSSWLVVVHVSSNTKGDTKENDLTVRVNDRGEVIEFNGVKLQKE